MKKLIISLAVLAGVCSCEHTAMEDAMCSTTYYIENQTDASFDVDGHTIQPGDKLEISRSSCLCGVKTVPKDGYYPWEMLAPIKTIIAGEKQLPDIIYRRRYWTYSHAKYYDDTYTLAITDEFIDKIGPYTSTYMLQNECSDDILVMWLPGPGADHAYASGYIQAGEGTTIFSPSADMGFLLHPISTRT